jgi:hypothetical protein
VLYLHKNIKLNLSFINGLLGTIILHLLAGIIFFSVKITGFYTHTIEVKIETPQSIKHDLEEVIEKKQQERERLMKMEKTADAFIANHNRKNIGVNVADKSPASMEKDLQDIQKDIEDAKKQISSIQENLDKQDQKLLVSDEKEAPQVIKKHEKIQGKLAVYKGPTNIYYDLAGRRDISLYIPVYKCEGYGKVVVLITVNQAGEVTSAIIDKAVSNTDACLLEASTDAALRSKFNFDNTKAPAKQRGTITYLFVAQ